MATTLFGVELEKILKVEKDLVRAERDKARMEDSVNKLRDFQSKLIMQTFHDLEVRLRRYRREISSLKEENRLLKNQLGAKDY
jgi:hypothetical protein